MKKALRILFLVNFSLAVLTLCPTNTSNQTPEPDIRRQRIDLHLSDATLALALGKLAVQLRVPVGVVVSAAERDEPKINIDVDDYYLEDVLNMLVQQVPDYKWEIRDGVVNFVPVSKDEFLQKFLNTHVKQFTARKGASKFEIRDAIFGLAEVQGLLKTSKVIISKFDYWTYPSIYSKEVDLNVSDTDVRGILNKVVRDSEHKLWVLQLKGEKRDRIEIAF